MPERWQDERWKAAPPSRFAHLARATSSARHSSVDVGRRKIHRRQSLLLPIVAKSYDDVDRKSLDDDAASISRRTSEASVRCGC